MEKELDIPVLQPGEKVIGSAYLTQDGEILFTPPGGVSLARKPTPALDL